MKVIILSNQGRSLAVFWRVLIRAMLRMGWQISACVPYGDDSPQELGIPVLHYRLERKGLNPVRDIASLVELYGIFKAQKPDILYATTIKPVIYGCLAAYWAKVPRIFATITGLGYAFEADTPFKKLVSRISGFLYKISLRHATGVFFQNPDDAELFLERGIINPKTPVYFARGTGVDTSHFAVVPLPSTASGDPFVFLLVARLLEAKGIYEYASAAKIIKAKYPNARFQLLGPPETGRGAISPENLRILQKDLEYLGETKDVRPYMAKAHVAVLPSWREGTPTALLEAMSMGRPLVAANSPGCREVVSDGVNGFLAETKNPEALAAAMQKFLEQPELARKMGKASRKLAEEKFDANVVAHGILAKMVGNNK